MRNFCYILFFLWSGQSYCAMCLDLHVISLQRPSGVLLKLQIELRNKVVLRLPVECQSRKPLIPKKREEAITFLDLAIPLDLKSSVTQGAGGLAQASGAFTEYLPNASSEVLFELGSIWNKGGYCKSFNKMNSFGPAGCTRDLYDFLRAAYSKRSPHNGITGEVSTPPSKEEQERRATQKECGPGSYYGEE